MILTLRRIQSQQNQTLGLLYIDGRFHSFTLEDEHREVKIKGETRIPDGNYYIKMRTEGRMHEKYKKRFPNFHHGMLHLQDVPGFTYVYIHIGNTDADTRGCPLVGFSTKVNTNGDIVLQQSQDAYVSLYAQVQKAIRWDLPVELKVITDDAIQARRFQWDGTPISSTAATSDEWPASHQRSLRPRGH